MLELVTTSQFKKDLKRLQEPARTLICSTEDAIIIASDLRLNCNHNRQRFVFFLLCSL